MCVIYMCIYISAYALYCANLNFEMLTIELKNISQIYNNIAHKINNHLAYYDYEIEISISLKYKIFYADTLNKV